MTEEELERIESAWKSDVDLKLDKLLKFMELMATREKILTTSVDELADILHTAQGALTMLYLLAKVMAAVSVLTATMYAFKQWILK